MSLQDELADWIISHCHRTCGSQMWVERETALMEADEIMNLPAMREVQKTAYKWDKINERYGGKL